MVLSEFVYRFYSFVFIDVVNSPNAQRDSTRRTHNHKVTLQNLVGPQQATEVRVACQNQSPPN